MRKKKERCQFREIERFGAQLIVNQTVPLLEQPIAVCQRSCHAITRLTMHRGSTASYYVVFRYVSQYKYPRGDASDKSDFSYDLPLCSP